jgi:cytochrome P450
MRSPDAVSPAESGPAPGGGAVAPSPPQTGPAVPQYDPAAKHQEPNALVKWLLHPPRWLLWYFRTLDPIVRVPGWVGLSRHADVAEVLERHDVFQVPFGGEIARLNDDPTQDGTPFVLGIDDEEDHRQQLKPLMLAFRRDDVEFEIPRMSREAADHHLGRAPRDRSMNAIQELITAVPLDICERYYGIRIAPDERQKFAYATIDVSGYLFGPPPTRKDPPDPVIEAAAAYIREVVDRSIVNQERNPNASRTTVLARLMAPPLVTNRGSSRDELADAELAKMMSERGGTARHRLVRSFMIGMITGFVPTNTMAGGHILQTLLCHRKWLDQARAAAQASDDDLLKRCLFETMRFMPLNPGPFRICTRDYTIAEDTRRAHTIKKGTKVLASTMSAMFDSRKLKRPFFFDPKRPASDYMLFGYGHHWCVGAFIAQAQITQTFKALLLQPKLERAGPWDGRLVLRGGFPDRLLINLGR